MQIIMGCFICPVASFAGCDVTYKHYNFFDIIFGNKTEDLFNCINEIMEETGNISISFSNPSTTEFSSSTSSRVTSNRIVKPRSVQNADKSDCLREDEVISIASSAIFTNTEDLAFCPGEDFFVVSLDGSGVTGGYARENSFWPVTGGRFIEDKLFLYSLSRDRGKKFHNRSLHHSVQ